MLSTIEYKLSHKSVLSWTCATLRPNIWIACCGFPLHRCLEWWARCSSDSLLSIDLYLNAAHSWLLLLKQVVKHCPCETGCETSSVCWIWVEVDYCSNFVGIAGPRKLHQILHEIGIKKWIVEEARIEVEYISGTRDFKTWTFAWTSWTNELSNLIPTEIKWYVPKLGQLGQQFIQ